MTDTSDVSQPMILLAVGGDPTAPLRVPAPLPRGSIVVAADSGLDRLTGLVRVDHVVGDLDSVSDAALRHAQVGGAEIHRHPADKDATDFELAVDLVVQHLAPATGLTTLLVVGGGAGRLDHLLADLLVLTAPSLAALDVTARVGAATVTVVRPGAGRTLSGPRHDQVSLLPVHGPADGVTTSGLRWPLVDAHLAAGTTRAMSNELVDAPASVRLTSGVLAVIQPGTVAAPVSPRNTPYDPTPRPPEGTPT
ncbi:thiamine diphosphokinase [Aquihabitans daechungensis]|uniref:thiamine diphosphokinase n=1 Tax=Aquihabitans daechungensis TaxID=1052257 RepID=UPI003BA19463